MKKGVYLVLFLLMIPLSNALLTIDVPVEDNYNIGDSISISGYVMKEKDFSGYLQLTVSCTSGDFPLRMTLIDIEKDQQYFFSSDIEVPPIVITSSMFGTCKLKAKLQKVFQMIETASSKEFSITKDLQSKFSIDKSKIPAGSTIKLKGEVSTMQGNPIIGKAEVYLSLNSTSFFLNTVDIKEGIMNFSYKATALPPEKYSLDIRVRDVYGNEKLFKGVASFTLSNELILSASLDKQKVGPGADVKISGDVRNILDEKLDNLSIKIGLSSNVFSAITTGGKFETKLTIPSDLKTGTQIITLTVKDGKGNSGNTTKSISILPKGTMIKNKINKLQLKPNETLEITALLYDQVSDLMDGEISLTLFDPNGQVIISRKLLSKQKLIYKIPSQALPGEWQILLKKGDIESKKSITMEEVKKIDVIIKDDVLEITNDGNVEYKDKVSFKFSNGKEEIEVKSKTNIKPNETIFVNLKEELPKGDYKAMVKTATGFAHLGNISLASGKSYGNPNGLLMLVIVLIIIVIILIVLYGSKDGSFGGRRYYGRPHVRVGRHKGSMVRKEKVDEGKEFTNRLFKSAKETEKKIKEDNKPDEPSSGMFNMFS